MARQASSALKSVESALAAFATVGAYAAVMKKRRRPVFTAELLNDFSPRSEDYQLEDAPLRMP